MDKIVDMVIKIYRKYSPKTNWDTRRFTDYGKAKKNLRFRLINTEKNEELLNTVPHRNFLDLSLIYTVEFPCDNGRGIASIPVKNEHVRMWAVDEEKMFRQVKKNMESSCESSLENMKVIFDRMRDVVDVDADDDFDIPMYVLSNRNRNYGAINMLDKNAMKAAADILGEDFLILPSSIHEVLLVPDVVEADELENVLNTVREVNDTQVSSQEILSYHVYRYEGATGRISIAA
jgi:hypothetical protein